MQSFAFFMVLLSLLIGPTRLAATPAELANVQNLVFVAGRSVTTVAAVSISSGEVVGSIDLGMVPIEMTVSDTLAKLAAIDGRSAGLMVADLAMGKREFIALPMAPTRVLMMPDARAVLLANDRSGDIVLFDLSTMQKKARIAGPAGIRDLLPSPDGGTIFIAAASVEGVAVHDVRSGQRLSFIGKGNALALARSQIGMNGYLLSAEGPDRFLMRFDMKTRIVREEIVATGLASSVHATVGGLILVDPASGNLATLPTEGWAIPVKLAATKNLDAVYLAFFDMLAFVPHEDDILVYDIESKTLLSRIVLSGKAGPGVVTPDSSKLYLPLENTHELIEVDAATRRVTAGTKLVFAPTLAAMAGSRGFCH